MSEEPSLADKFDRTMKRLMGYKPLRDPRKEENPIFATFQDRVIASVLDVGIMYLLFQSVFKFISAQVFQFVDYERFRTDMEVAPEFSTMEHHIRYVVDAAFASDLALLWVANSALQAAFAGIIFVFIWHEFHLTPGKYVIGLEFAGRHGEGKPTLRQYIIRFLSFYISMPVFMLGFAILGFDKQKRAVHDRIAGTTVIYSKRGSIFRQGWDILKKQFRK